MTAAERAAHKSEPQQSPILADVERLAVQYPGGLSARYRWAGSGRAADVFAASEATGELADHGPLAGAQPDRLCRMELRVESPTGAWTARFASLVFDDPYGVYWDSESLLLVKYGFSLYALEGRTGELRWHHASATPALVVLASSRIDHAIFQTEIETIALRADGSVAWRAAHSEVIAEAQLIAGRVDLTTYTGEHLYLDARTGQAA